MQQSERNKFFTNKEHYLKFKKAWSEIFNDLSNRKIMMKDCDDFSWTDSSNTNKINTWLPGEYHLFYALMRGVDPTESFSEEALDPDNVFSIYNRLGRLTYQNIRVRFGDVVTEYMFQVFLETYFIIDLEEDDSEDLELDVG